MPSLRDALLNAKLPNYVPAPAAPTVISVQPLLPPANANQRFILPPFNADPDSVNQFQGTSPKIRVWPRPQQKAIGTTSVATGGSTSAGSSSSSSSTSTLVAKTVTLTTNSLPAGSVYKTTLQMSASFQLINMTTNGPCEVRIYGTQTAQLFDASRPSGNPVAPETTQNIVTCVTFDTNPFVWTFQNITGANGNNPQTASVYISVLNTVPTLATPVTVTITYLPLES